jgi:hypothetical protein
MTLAAKAQTKSLGADRGINGKEATINRALDGSMYPG